MSTSMIDASMRVSGAVSILVMVLFTVSSFYPWTWLYRPRKPEIAIWYDRRQAETPEVISGQAIRLPALIGTARNNGADLVILDTAPNADQTASLAARAADVVLCPCRPAAFDLDAIGTTLMLTKAANNRMGKTQ